MKLETSFKSARVKNLNLWPLWS